jgi:nonsense-mediated mRNA decay protein 3
MKCIQCSKEAKNAVLCHECFQKKHTALKKYTEHTLLICPRCQSYKYQKQWKPAKPNALKESVLAHCNFLIQPDAIDIEFLHMTIEGIVETGTAVLRIETTVDSQKLFEEFEFPVRVKKVLCDRCGKLKTEYYEGILQLRGENKNILEKADAYILKDALSAEKKNVFITQREEAKNGFDYYYTKQQYLPVIMNKLVEVFGATAKTHAELFSKSRETSKDVYRVNASVRLPLYCVGAVVVCGRKTLQIVKMGKQITALDLKNWTNTSIDAKKIENVVLPEEFKKVQVVKTYPHLEILHPETYQAIAVENSFKTDEKEVFIAIINGNAWVVKHS